MTKRSSKDASPALQAPDKAATLIRAGLDTLNFGFAIFDSDLKLVASNKAFRTLRGYPAALCEPGTEIIEFYRFNAERGDYGPGDVEALAKVRLNRVRKRQPHELEYELASGQILNVQYTPIIHDGLVLAYADITARNRAEQEVVQKEAQLRVALDNMPGALAYTDEELNIVVCNDRFADMYPAPRELLQPGRPYPDFLRYLAEHGYYGDGDVDALVAKRVESLRNPSGETFEDSHPDGHVYEVYRRRAAPGGAVTVITDITGLKRAEENLARKEAQLHVALDNMPGALVYTDNELNIVVCNDRFSEMYPVPSELLQPGCPYADFLRYLAEHGYYGDGDVDTLVAKRVESLRNPSGRAFEDRTPNDRVYRIGRRHVASGGTVTVMTDVTELKDAETKLLEAKQRVEEASRLVTEKNQMLESLSSKLSKYLSPQLYKSIFSGEKNVEVASQRKKLTIFFSDIAGFTETTDLLESEELTSLLNQYLREMSSIALEYGATIDKFIGDAIMLFFGDPETRGVKEDAVACVKMAIAMQQRMRDLQAAWREGGQEHVFQLRIGINTGYCTVGNFGSDDRVDYTIIGNEVNLAARLQSHADLGGILLAHETYSLVKDTVLAEETGTITVKGFAKPVRTHRVVGLHDGAGIQGRVIRQEQDGMLLIIDQHKLTGKGRAEAIRALQEVVGQLTDKQVPG
ncbi:MAG TPA: PAS-domain containing protein [Casimicrobiaceae bacterium]|jgi:class 3 adenylate cyclase/PAS domain-containing protein|nr:PAS-domain containing protein [Casimicrobiaceae bacterium]